eukprot:353354-Chlamydomonas_euryale.AAC.2
MAHDLPPSPHAPLRSQPQPSPHLQPTPTAHRRPAHGDQGKSQPTPTSTSPAHTYSPQLQPTNVLPIETK